MVYQDLELAMRKAMKTFAPGAVIEFCVTHLYRSWVKKLQSLGLWKGDYTISDRTCGMIKVWQLLKGNRSFFLNLIQCYKIGIHIDVVNGCWRPNVSVTSFGCHQHAEKCYQHTFL